VTFIQSPKYASRLLAVGTRLDSLFSAVTPMKEKVQCQ
jgi:hypothetical protein